MTAVLVSSAHNNLLLGSLARDDRELLEPHLEPVTLKLRHRLEAANRKIERVCYIDAGLASVVAVGGPEKRMAEVAIIGREGMTGVAVTLGIDRAPHDTFMQIEGHGRCISASIL